MDCVERNQNEPPPLPSYEGVRSLVLGGSGFIGRWVARELAAAGAAVHVTARNADATRTILAEYGANAVVHAVDLAVPGEVARVVDEVRPEVTFNLVGYGVDQAERDPDIAEIVNVRLVEDLARALAARPSGAERGFDLVHVGSAAEYGRSTGDLREGSVEAPETLYGRTKLEGTRALRAATTSGRPRAVTARLFTVYGPGEHPGRLLPTLLEAAGADGAIPLTHGLQERDFAHVRDVAGALLALGRTDRAAGEVVNLATGRLTTVRAFAETAARVLHISPERLRFGALPVRAEEMRHLPVNVDRMRQWLGHTLPADLRAGIAWTRDFFDRRTAPAGIGHARTQTPEE